MADHKTETVAKADAPKTADTHSANKSAAHAPAHSAAHSAHTPAHTGTKAAEPVKAAATAAAKAAPAARKTAPKARKPRAARPTVARPAAARPARAAKPARRTQPVRTAVKAAQPIRAAARKTVKTTTDSINEGTKTMKKEANQMADRVQAAFGDYNDRAKTALERNARFAEELTELQKGNVQAFVASTKVAARGVETLGQEVAELSRRSFEEASAAMRGFAEVKSPTDFFRLQGDFARGQFDTLVAESAKMSEAMIKLAGDVAQPLASRYSVAAEKVKTAVAA